MKFLITLFLILSFSQSYAQSNINVLVYSRTTDYRHPAIESGLKAFNSLASEKGFNITSTEEAEMFTPENLKNFTAVVFLNTSGVILDENQKKAFQDYILNGGGFVGVHAASFTELDWPWFGELVGRFFKGHPKVQEAIIKVVDNKHPATSHLPQKWTWTEEWIDFHPLNSKNLQVVLKVDEDTYEGGGMGEDHPIAWYQKIGKGRSFYTGLGHTDESYSDTNFLQHLYGAIYWASTGKNKM
ncbi:hypothetical protein BH23BAC1_BH23BAC1_14050 [soil metagenome]